MKYLVLNQYREGSSYKDTVGKLYHFPVRYRRCFSELPSPFVYYEPREGGQQVYFGTGSIFSVYEDTEDVGHAYAEVHDYESFPSPLDFYSKPEGRTWEDPKTMRNSVRTVTEELFQTLLVGAGVTYKSPTVVEHESQLENLQRELNSFPPPGKRNPIVLRRIRRILESYERPSAVTNYVKRTRGDRCQLCRTNGFLKRDGNRYCEIHHLFHLATDPPVECLSPEYLVVLCATCHRRMHYAEVSQPMRVPEGWRLRIDNEDVLFAVDGRKGSG